MSVLLLLLCALSAPDVTRQVKVTCPVDGTKFEATEVRGTNDWGGKSFLELMLHMKEVHNALLVGVEEGDKIVVNPTSYVFKGDEDVVLIAARDVKL